MLSADDVKQKLADVGYDMTGVSIRPVDMFGYEEGVLIEFGWRSGELWSAYQREDFLELGWYCHFLYSSGFRWFVVNDEPLKMTCLTIEVK